MYQKHAFSLVELCVVIAILVNLAGIPCPAMAEGTETAGVLPSWWIPELPSVAIPGDRNAVDPVAMRANSGTLLVAAEGRSNEGGGIQLSGSVAAVTRAASPGPFEGNTYLDIHRAGGARPKAEIVFDSDVTGSDTLTFSFAINLPTGGASDAGCSIILKDSSGAALNTIVAYDDAGGTAEHYWRLNEGNHAGKAEFPPALAKKPAGAWEKVTITRAADASLFQITVDGVSATYGGVNLQGTGALHSISFETNGAGGYFLDGVPEPSSGVSLARSTDDGSTWDSPREIARGSGGDRISAGAAGTLRSGRLVLALHEWSETPGQVTHVTEQPAGVHHYLWSGFRRQSALQILVSDDEGATWTQATANVEGGPSAISAAGDVFNANGAAWFPVYGPFDEKEMDSALSGMGLMHSDDNGDTWRFSHWVARADQEQGIGYGPGEVTVLPDGRWLGLLQGNYRRLGDYTRPRICRTISSDGGRSWSAPQHKLLGHGCSTVPLDGDQIMVGGWKDRGIMFTVGSNAGADWLYQDQVWWCIWYNKGHRGGTRLLDLKKRPDSINAQHAAGQNLNTPPRSVLVVYHWMDTSHAGLTEVRAQVVRRSAARPQSAVRHTAPVTGLQWKWEMAEAYQVPDMEDAPAGIRSMTLLKLQSGDWMCIGFVGSKKAGTAYGFAPTGLGLLRSPSIDGPWKKVADVPTPKEVGEFFDTGTGAGLPRYIIQHSSGRLLLPFSTKDRKDIILTYSDDEGRTWKTGGSMAGITGLPVVLEADELVELSDGSLVFPMQRAFDGSTGQHPLFYVRSSDRGETWNAPVFWATHPGTRYEGLPHGPLGDLRETGLAILSDKRWLGIYRESRGTPAPEDYNAGPLSMPFLCLARSTDGGRHWSSSFGFLGVEPSIRALPGGAVMVACRDDNLASVWLSYDQGDTWQVQHDPAELPWGRGAAEAHGQWPPGGSSIIRVLDENTAVVICDTGLIPVGKLLPAGYQSGKELHGRVQVRYFRRRPAVQ